MKLLETRRREGYTMRRFIDEQGVRVTTWEVPLTVLKAIGLTRVRQAIAKSQRGIERRTAALRLKIKIIALLQEGWKPAAISHELQTHVSYVCRLRKGMEDHAND